MARQLRIDRPPRVSDTNLQRWLERVSDALNALPAFSIFSGNPNTSGVTANIGTIGIDINPSATSVLWINKSGTTASWSFLSYI